VGAPFRLQQETDMTTIIDQPVTDPVPGRALFVSVRLFLAADAFFFLGFLFAYLYLRALNTNHSWHPAGTDPSTALGTVLVVVVVVAAAAFRYAAGRDQRPVELVAIGLVLVALICQGVQLFNPGFSPSHGGGYGAVFVGFSAAFAAHLLGALYWLETVTVDREATPEERGMHAQAASLFMTFLAGVAVVAYILIYLI
jgi:heme/copper-type cytochrome/quinol oxidase subunit 3